TLYRVPDPQATYLRRLAPSARPKGWWDAYADTLSAGYANLIRLEAGSRALRCYASLVPHALLQSPAYDREILLATWETLAPAAASWNTCSRPAPGPTSPSRCCRLPPACPRSPPARSPSWTPWPRARPTSSTWRTRPGCSSSTPKPRCTATPRRMTTSAPRPSP